MKKFKEKQNKCLDKYQQTADNVQQKEQSSDCCMICHSEEKGEGDILCYLAHFRYSNLLNAKIGQPQELNPIFITCEHVAHFQCCQDAFGNK